MKKIDDDFGFVCFEYNNGFDSKEQYQTIKKRVKKWFPYVKDVELENGWKVKFISKDGSESFMMNEHLNMIK